MPHKSCRTSNPPPYLHSNRNYNPATYIDGRSGNERSNLLPHRSNYDFQSTSTEQSYTQTTYTDNRNDNYGSPRRTKRTHTAKSLLCIFLLLAITLSVIAVFFYPSTEWNRENIRRQWEAEERHQQDLRNGWNAERKAMVEERETWEKERSDHRLERKAMAEEREQWRKERADHENRERQEEEEKRALIVWEDLKPSTRCLRYGTREYSATLAQVSLGLDPLKECWNKSIDIHGRQMFPTRCDTQGTCGNVVGHWTVDFNEATCVTWWRGYDDKGCVERGIHRYESVLENLQNGDDWHEMCATTPGRVQGRDFQGPTSCASWRSGINAIWLIEDENCL